MHQVKLPIILAFMFMIKLSDLQYSQSNRAEELWEEGVLVSEKQLDPNEDG